MPTTSLLSTVRSTSSMIIATASQFCLSWLRISHRMHKRAAKNTGATSTRHILAMVTFLNQPVIGGHHTISFPLAAGRWPPQRREPSRATLKPGPDGCCSRPAGAWGCGRPRNLCVASLFMAAPSHHVVSHTAESMNDCLSMGIAPAARPFQSRALLHSQSSGWATRPRLTGL